MDFLFFCRREVKSHLPSNDSVSQDDFVLMTLFPQRRISQMESTLESAGKTVGYYIQILQTDIHLFYI